MTGDGRIIGAVPPPVASGRMRSLIWICRLAWPLLLVPTLAVAQLGDAALRVERLRAGETLPLTGRLDHPAWQRAPRHGAFVEIEPDLDAAPAQATMVRLLSDDAALYVGIDARDDAPDAIRAPWVRHDQVTRSQDHVGIYLDPIGTRRAAQFFRVNAAGSLADGMHTAADNHEDLAPDFDWDAAVHRGPQGWTAVLRLPFAALRFADDPAAPWRLLIVRSLPRDQQHLLASARVPRESTSIVEALQPLQGLSPPSDHGFLTLRPSLTWRHVRSDAPGVGTGPSAEASLDLKWRPRAELVVDGTLNPDFSQVALDVPQLAGNARFALVLEEKRPFFFESSDLLRSPTEALYTRSISDPRAGLRATWRGASLAGTVFAVDDRGGGAVLLPGPYGTDTAAQPASRVVAGRTRWDAGEHQTGLLLATRRYEGDRGENTVIGPDWTWRGVGAWQWRAQWLQAHTTARADGGQLRRGPAQGGGRRWLQALYLGDREEFSATVDDTDAGFRHDSGFVGQAGTRKATVWAAQGWGGVGPLNEFWVNAEAWQVIDKASGRTVERKFRPGVWVTAPGVVEAWFEVHLDSHQRLAADQPWLAERFADFGAVLTPGPRWPLLEIDAGAGRMADATEGIVRRGQRWQLRSQFRVGSRLEFEPRWDEVTLSGAGLPLFRERAVQALAVWHLGPRSHLRAIVQRQTLARGESQLPPLSSGSLIWSWRHSAGTVAYVGVSRAGDGEARTREFFVKLQADVDQVTGLF